MEPLLRVAECRVAECRGVVLPQGVVEVPLAAIQVDALSLVVGEVPPVVVRSQVAVAPGALLSSPAE